jgi:1-phosphofructokinase family hexose kinase
VIVTVTVNPALDVSYDLGGPLVVGETLRGRRVRREPGGNGINAARVIHRLGGPVVACGLAGGFVGAELRALLDAEGVAHQLVPTAEQTRVNAIFVGEGEPLTRVLAPGPRLAPGELAALAQAVEAASPSLLVIGGSAPPGVPRELYASLIQSAHRRGVRTLLDADRELLRLGIEARPFLVKPNERELMALVGHEVDDEAARLAAARELHRLGVEVVVLSLGPQGALVVWSGGALRATLPVESKGGKIGAGDSMVGAMAYALEQGLDIPEVARYGVAAGAAAVAVPGIELARAETVLRYLPKVELQVLR